MYDCCVTNTTLLVQLCKGPFGRTYMYSVWVSQPLPIFSPSHNRLTPSSLPLNQDANAAYSTVLLMAEWVQ